MLLCVCAQSCPPSCGLWTVARQAPLSLGFSRQEDWSELPLPAPGHPPGPGADPKSRASPALAGGSSTTKATWEAGGGAWPLVIFTRLPDPSTGDQTSALPPCSQGPTWPGKSGSWSTGSLPPDSTTEEELGPVLRPVEMAVDETPS